MRKLFEINKDIEELLDESINQKLNEDIAVNTETGVVINLTERLDALKIEKAEKIKSVAMYADDIAAKLENVTKKVKDLEKTKKTLSNELDGLMDYLLYATDKKGFESDEISVQVKRKTRGQCIVFDFEALPEEFKRTKIEVSAMRDDITKAIKSGIEVPGASVEYGWKVTII